MKALEDLIENIIKRAKEEPKLIFQERARCPVCGSHTLIIKEYIYNIPYFSKIVLSEGRCERCGYRFVDVRALNASRPKKIVIKVNGERELRYLLVKSATSAVLIEERGYEMIPGPASTGFITTVEGILYRFLDAAETACKGREEERGCKDNITWLKRAIDGLEKFTLVICDYEGTSLIRGEFEEQPLDEECEKLRNKSLKYFYKDFVTQA